MIIVPNYTSKQLLEGMLISEPILLLSEYLTILLSDTEWEIASDSIIEYHLLKWVKEPQVNLIKQHIAYILSESLSVDSLSQSNHPNTKWIVEAYHLLINTLAKAHLIHPKAIIKTVIESNVSSHYSAMKHYGFSLLDEATCQFFKHYHIMPYDLPKVHPKAFQQCFADTTSEIQHAIDWHLNTPDSGILVMSPQYASLLAQYEYHYTGYLPKAANESLMIEAIIHITSSQPKIPQAIIPHLKYSHQYPEGFSIYQLVPTNAYNQAWFVSLEKGFSYVHQTNMQSGVAISAETYINIIKDILALWRINTLASSPLGKQITHALNDIHTLSYLSIEQPYQQWHHLFSRRLKQGTLYKTQLNIITPQEAQGAQFQSLWVLGSQSDNWESIQALSALSPRLHKRVSLSFIQQSAKEMIYSYPILGDSGEQLTLPDNIKAQTYTYKLCRKPVELHLMNDWTVTHEDAEIAGGVSLIQDYATCPFKAFARQRLKLQAKKQKTHDIPPHHYGTITHDALEKVYQTIIQQEDLLHIDEMLIRQTIDTLWQTSPLTAPLHPELKPILKQKMTTTILEWVDIDKNREPFSIKQLESTIHLPLGSHHIKLRIDRIDQVNGQPILIDYKTGRANITDTFHPDFIFPQMALYTLSQNKIPAIAFAKVLHLNSSWQAIDLACEQSRHKALEARLADKQSFESLRDRWHQQAIDCLTQFEAGHYPATPIHAQACDQCDFKSFCRIYDQGVYT